MEDLFLVAEEEYRVTFDADIQLLDYAVHPDGESGLFIDPSGTAYDFATHHDSGESVYLENEHETAFYQDYAIGMLQTEGVDYRGDSEAYGFLMGLLTSRNDAALKCTGGNVACGKRCIPKGQVCRSKGGGGKAKLGALAGAAALGGLAASTAEGRAKGKTAAKQAAQGAGNVAMGEAKRRAARAKGRGGLGQMGIGLVQGATGNKEGGKENFTKGGRTVGEAVKERAEAGGQLRQGVDDLAAGARSAAGAVVTSAKIQGKNAKNAVKSAPGNIKQKFEDMKNKVKTVKTKKGKDKPPEKTKKEKKKREPSAINVKAA